jgi:hypothetical protein
VTATIAPGAVNVAANSYGSTNNVNANGTGGSVAPITVSPTIAPVVSANGGNVAPISVVATGGKSDSNTGPISTTVVNKPNVDVSSSSISASSAEAAANAAAKTVTPVSIGVLPPDFKPIPDHSFPPPCDYITSDGGDQ